MAAFQRFISKHLFWVLQVLGWGAFSCFTAMVANWSERWEAVLLIVVSNALLFIAMTSLLRWILNKWVPIDNFKALSLLKIIIIVSIFALIFPTIAYYIGFGVGRFARLLFSEPSVIFNTPAAHPSSYSNHIGYAIIIFGWTIFFYVIKLIRKSNEERIKRLRLKDEVKQAQLNTLKGHINPQFIFSSLSTIKNLMLEDVPKSRAMLTTLAEMLRYSLIKNNINGIPLAEELEVSKDYISLFTMEATKRFQVSYTIAPETLSLLIPPLLLPNLIELATRFGMLEAKKEDCISLKSELKNQRLKITVAHTSNMVISKSRQTLENTLKQRLKLLYGNQASYMTNHENNNYTLWVTLPITPSTNKKD